jgi:Uma2 family endonuclease
MITMAMTTEPLEELESQRTESEIGYDMPSKKHARVQLVLGAILYAKYNAEFFAMSQVSIQFNGKDLIPDLAVYPQRADRMKSEEIVMSEPPLFVVEILSPKQGIFDLEEKIQTMFAAGVKSAWLVIPPLEQVAVYESGKKPRVFPSGVVTDGVTGIAINVEELFK